MNCPICNKPITTPHEHRIPMFPGSPTLTCKMTIASDGGGKVDDFRVEKRPSRIRRAWAWILGLIRKGR